MRVPASLRKFTKDTSGTTMVEFAICIALFLLILFAVLDFGRLGYNWVMTEKAMQRAVRIATVRPPVCENVPFYHQRNNTDTSNFDPGARCSSSTGLCEDFLTQCLLSSPPANSDAATAANEIWNSIAVLLPNGATRGNVQIRYEQTDSLGFLGGPFTPIVTATFVGDGQGGEFPFQFITPLSALAAAAGASNGTDSEMFPETVDGNACTACIPFPNISVSLPAEDMNIGDNG